MNFKMCAITYMYKKRLNFVLLFHTGINQVAETLKKKNTITV